MDASLVENWRVFTKDNPVGNIRTSKHMIVPFKTVQIYGYERLQEMVRVA